MDAEEFEALRGCFERNWFTEGPESARFVEELGQLMGFEHACLAPNGTLALCLGLLALEIGPGDEVVVPDFTFFGSASAVQLAGATPVFCDVDSATLQVTADRIEAVLTSRTRAIMPVHIYGMTCDMDPILELARRRDLLVIEDAAQAVGVFYKGRHAGTDGDVGCFSFFADKTLTTGEGGLVVARDEAVFSRLQLLRNQGRENRGSFIHPAIGYNFRMTDLQAAIGRVQLAKLDTIKERKTRLLERYRELLGGLDQVCFIDTTHGSTHIPFRIAIYADRATELMKHLESRDIQTRTFFYPLHRQPGLEALLAAPEHPGPSGDEAFPGAVYAYENGLCLPSYPGLPMADLELVCDAIREFYA